MGVETAAILAAAASSAGTAGAATAAGGALAAGAAGTAAAAGSAAAAGATAAGAAGSAAAGLTAAEAGMAAATIAEGAGAAAGTAAGSTGVAAGSLEAANMVGAIGGDALGAFVSANQGFGTMTAAESVAGFGASLQSSPLVQGLQQANTASSAAPEEQAPTINMAPMTPTERPNQDMSLTQPGGGGGGMSAATQQASSLSPLGFANGGQVPQNDLQRMAPDNIWARTRQRREEEAGLGSPGGSNITINVGGQAQAPAPAPAPTPQQESTGILQLIRQAAGYQNGGEVRTGSSDVRAGGEIRGPESKSGRDNQIIKVAGGEGILPKDVMDVPGVADMVQALIKTYHKPL